MWIACRNLEKVLYRDGPEWSNRRKSLNRIFLKKEMISAYSDDFNNVITDLLSSWTLKAKDLHHNCHRDQPDCGSSLTGRSKRFFFAARAKQNKENDQKIFHK